MAKYVVAAAVLLMASGGAVPQQKGVTARIAEFENEEVRVWKAIITPNAPLTMHRHDHPRVIVALTGGDVKIVQQSGGNEMNHWQTGEAYWLPATKPGQMHADVNVGSKPIEVMVVELKKEQ